ncbi:hypothetical protein [Caldimonas tepidiphila]|uniref:hypothetical protein n=1 Tax=Caldimonas tepidiphila TaxID=2315841 RepID=UPI001F0B88F0|nr:hypothetical protein [Caldimonas tepidiphila]
METSYTSHPAYRPVKNPNSPPRAFARRLGWFSIGLGIAELLFPRAISRTLGARRDRSRLVSAYGLREIATGVGLLASHNPRPWVIGRMAGDALDLATLLPLVRGLHPRRLTAASAITAVAGIAALDWYCERRLAAEQQRRNAVWRDYSDRSGLPKPAAEMRGAAANDGVIPRDMRAPEAMRPYGTA